MKYAALLALALMGAPAFAQNYPPPPEDRGRPYYPERRDDRELGVFLGAGLSSLAYDLDGATTNPVFATFQFRGGVIINRYLSVGAQISRAYHDYEKDNGDDELYDSEDFHLNSATTVFIQPRIPIGRHAGVYARVGWHETEIEAFGNDISGDGPAYGAGFDVDIGPLTVALELEGYDLDFELDLPLGTQTNTGKGGSATISLVNRF